MSVKKVPEISQGNVGVMGSLITTLQQIYCQVWKSVTSLQVTCNSSTMTMECCFVIEKKLVMCYDLKSLLTIYNNRHINMHTNTPELGDDKFYNWLLPLINAFLVHSWSADCSAKKVNISEFIRV